MLYFIEQCLNGIQLGMLLFMLAAGLTLIFGIMDLVNLAHGSLYMLGAYFAATFAQWTDSFVLGAVLAYFGLREAQQALPYALAFAAAGFLYIAVAGLIPGLHRRVDPRTSAVQVLLIAAGVSLIAAAERLTGQ